LGCGLLVFSLSCSARPAGRPAGGEMGPVPDAQDQPFTMIAVGDAGLLSQELYNNAIGVNREVLRAKPERRAMVLLGDNFYPRGLSTYTQPAREARYQQVYGLFEPAIEALRSDACQTERARRGETQGDCTETGTSYFHAVTGNHDYYSGGLAAGGLDVASFGFSVDGNEYAALRGTLTPDRLAEVKNSEMERTAAGGKAEKKPQNSWGWRYHFGLPGDEYWPIDPASPASGEIHAIFFDSAAFVRSAENCNWQWSPTTGNACQGIGTGRNMPQGPLSCEQARCVLHTFEEILDSEKGREVKWRVLVAHHPIATVGEHGGYTWSAAEGRVVLDRLCSKDEHPDHWLKNTMLEPVDRCSRGWEWYVEQLARVLKEKNKRFDLALTGHDHSLQLLLADDTSPVRFEVVSGAATKRSVVRAPGPATPREKGFTHAYTAPRRWTDGRAEMDAGSRSGFARIDELRVRFFEGWRAISPVQMGLPAKEGAPTARCFVITREGLVPQAQECTP
jgi:hypothetical protein